jgi:hypothetical protein
MPIIEKLGSFYLGKEYDLKARQLKDVQVNYDSRDLTTHAVCVGMTGSGKTGLCIDLIEEAALDGVPAILIDPKGDITNLLLTFPELRPEDFKPWINPDDAARKGMSVDDFAVKTATDWRNGLASWEEGPDRIKALKAAADFAIYTPGSEAGLPVSILASFKAPSLDWDTETEILRDRIQGTVSALLGLVGIDADPVRSREHILLSSIIENAWRAGQDLDIARLIMAVQKPPFRQVGVFEVDTFFPEKDRFALAMTLNNIIASPSFSAWMSGEPLDIGALLHTPAGKPRHSIFYIAHLSDAERMFFVTILLEQVISWMRAQPGTTSLRALLYMDEVFGYFPPTANPPSKRPMLTLMKQARAFGLGVMLTTQNPVDLDYKGLTNAGTWFIGKLQAERDKARLLEGLQGALSSAGVSADVNDLDKTITSLDSRVFLLHNINLKAPVIFQTRWAMSYLRGPLTRQQIKTLMAPRKSAAPELGAVASTGAGAAAGRAIAAPAAPEGLVTQPPVLPPGAKQVFLPVTLTPGQAVKAIADRLGGTVTATEKRLVYEPVLIGFATVRFADRRLAVDESQDMALLAQGGADSTLLSWKGAAQLKLDPRDLTKTPEEDAFFFSAIPDGATNARTLSKLTGDLVDELYRTQGFDLAYNPTLKLYGRPGESERDFRVRCDQVAREQRDAEVDKLKTKYQAQLDRIEEKLAREQGDLAEAKSVYKGRQTEEVISGLETVAGMFGLFGRRKKSLSSAATKRRMASTAKANVAESEADIARLQAQVEDVKSQMEEDANALTEQWTGAATDIQVTKIAPKKTDIDVQIVALAWAPNWEVTYEDSRGRSRTEAVAAYPGTQQA